MVKYNARILNSSVSGVQRYLNDFSNHLPDRYEEIKPEGQGYTGFKGHLWEQLVLPLKMKGKLLWSPSNTGPIAYKNQVVTIHDAVSFDHPEWLNANFVKFYTSMQPLLAKRVKKIVTISNFSKERLIKHLKIAEEKIDIIYNGVDGRFFNSTPNQNERQSLNALVGDKEYVLTLSTIEPRKNLESIVEAWSRVSNKFKDVNLVIVGKQGKSTIFKNSNLHSEKRNILFTGYVEDKILPMLYRNARAFIYLPFYEGFGLPPLEAMSCGAPVITSNCTSIPEVVGDSAIMVDPYNLQKIEEVISDAISDEVLLTEMSRKGLDRCKLFRIADKAIELETLFKEIDQ